MPMPEDERATPADERASAALSRFWNDAVAGNPGPTDGVAPDLAATVRRLQALGRPPTPDPTFANQLWEDLMSQAQASSLEQATMATVPTLAPGVNGRRSGAILPRAEGRLVRPRRWWQAVEVAAVA